MADNVEATEYAFDLKTNIKDYVLCMISKLYRCNLILTDGAERLIGLSYKKEEWAPTVIVKNQFALCHSYILKVAQRNGITCRKNKRLTKSIVENAEEEDFLPSDYWKPVAHYYADFLKKDEEELFVSSAKLKEDVLIQLFEAKTERYRRAVKEYKKSIKTKEAFIKKQKSNSLESEIDKLKESYGIGVYQRKGSDSEQYMLEHIPNIKDCETEYNQLIGITNNKGEICIYTYGVCEFFPGNKSDGAIGLVRALLEVDESSLQYSKEKYCKEFDINQKDYENALDSIKAILRNHQNQTEQEYECLDYRGIMLELYLKKSPTRMYRICITYKEFLRSPNTFEKLISNPHELNKWNFWCHERKLIPEGEDG